MPVPQPHAEPENGPGAGACAERARRDVDAVRDRQPRRAPAPAPACRRPGAGQAEDRCGALAGGLGQHRLRGRAQALRGPGPPDGHSRAALQAPRPDVQGAQHPASAAVDRREHQVGHVLRPRHVPAQGPRDGAQEGRDGAQESRRHGRAVRQAMGVQRPHPDRRQGLEQPRRRPRDRLRRGDQPAAAQQGPSGGDLGALGDGHRGGQSGGGGGSRQLRRERARQRALPGPLLRGGHDRACGGDR